MELCNIRGTTHPFVRPQGLEGKEISSPSGRGRKMSLTSPLIDQAMSQTCTFHSPFWRSVSAIGMFQQLREPSHRVKDFEDASISL